MFKREKRVTIALLPLLLIATTAFAVTISVDFKKDFTVEDRDLLCEFWGYSDTITNATGAELPNPQSKKAFIIEKWKKMLLKRIATLRLKEAESKLLDGEVVQLKKTLDY